MRTKLICSAGCGLLIFAAVADGAEAPGQKPANALAFLGKPVTQGEIQVGKEIYEANCASCHGVDLQGQPDWRRRLENGRMPAPPHDGSGHSWSHSDKELFTITKDGVGSVVPGYESDMPAFGKVLGEAEIAAVLGYIKSTWPERQRAVQAGITARKEAGK